MGHRLPTIIPEDARWNAERRAVEFGSRVGAATCARTAGRVRTILPWKRGDPMNKVALVMIWLAVLLAGCGSSLRGDASAGPNPGGGFYGAPNIDIGRINP